MPVQALISPKNAIKLFYCIVINKYKNNPGKDMPGCNKRLTTAERPMAIYTPNPISK